jgi:preprotein translocase subunit SecA
MFSFMMDQLKTNAIGILAKARFKGEEDAESVSQQAPNIDKVKLSHNDRPAFQSSGSAQKKSDTKTFVRDQDKIGRNEPCPCGSGKKYKKCHGMITQ